jgi:hypothetical protein
MQSNGTSHRLEAALLSLFVTAAALGLSVAARPPAAELTSVPGPPASTTPSSTAPTITAPTGTTPSTTVPPSTVPFPAAPVVVTSVRPSPPEPPTTPTTTARAPSAYDYLSCVRHRESRAQYVAVNGQSGAGGAYQFLPATWDATARRAGRADLVGVHPSRASQRDQDVMAAYLLSWQGPGHWDGPGC